MSNEVGKRIERARGERNLFLALAKFPIGKVERERTEFDPYEIRLSGLRVSERRPVATFRHFPRFPQDFRGSLHLQHDGGNVRRRPCPDWYARPDRGRGEERAMGTRQILLVVAAGVLSTWSLWAVAGRQQPAGRGAGSPIPIDVDDIAGVVTSTRGPEAGVWVIAETSDTPTKLRKIVVT